MTPPASGKADRQPKLLSGGNPQIAKGFGEEPVQAYIAAMPGWKSAIGERLDSLVTKAVPDVRKAVKWNSPSTAWTTRPGFSAFTAMRNT